MASKIYNLLKVSNKCIAMSPTFATTDVPVKNISVISHIHKKVFVEIQ